MVSGKEHIKRVLDEIKLRGYSTESPFCIGKNSLKILRYSLENGLRIAEGGLYSSAHTLSHMTRLIKRRNGIAVPENHICDFPNNRKKMDLYYDRSAGLFIYVDEKHKSKYVIHPFYRVQIKRKITHRIMFITASKLKSTENFHFDRTRYEKI